MRSFIPLFFILLFFTQCAKKDRKHIDIDTPIVNIEIERLEAKLSSFDTTTQVAQFIAEYPLYAKEFLRAGQFSDINYLLYELVRMGKDLGIDTLTQDAENAFPTMSFLNEKLSSGFNYLTHYYPKHPIPKVYSHITGFGTDLFVRDSIIVIGLDFFMAGKSKFIPKDIPGYILDYYSEEYIPTKVMALVSQRYNAFDRKDQTALSQMIHYGKSYYFIESMYPSFADSIVIEYSAKEVEDLKYMAPKVWAHFVENKLFFSTKREVIRRYIDDRPNTTEIADKCPGRIGRWLGWQIVRSYMKKHPEVSLNDLMEEKDASKIFKESKYRP